MLVLWLLRQAIYNSRNYNSLIGPSATKFGIFVLINKPLPLFFEKHLNPPFFLWIHRKLIMNKLKLLQIM